MLQIMIVKWHKRRPMRGSGSLVPITASHFRYAGTLAHAFVHAITPIFSKIFEASETDNDTPVHMNIVAMY